MQQSTFRYTRQHESSRYTSIMIRLLVSARSTCTFDGKDSAETADEWAGRKRLNSFAEDANGVSKPPPPRAPPI